MKKVFGYVTSRPFGDFVMPVPAQNSCLREYCKNIGAQYVLPRLEHKFDNCFMQLFSIGKVTKQSDIVVMYSVEIIINSQKALTFIKNKVSEGVEFHFVLENLHVSDDQSFDTLKGYRILNLKPMKKDALISYLKQRE